MSKFPYPLERPSDMPLEKYLLNLLTAIVKQNGGEVRLTASAILSATGCALIKAPSEKMDALTLRATSQGTETYFVSEAPAWTAQPTPRTRIVQPSPQIQTQQHENVPKTSRSKQLDDMALYLREQEMMEHRANLQREQQGQDLRETGVFPWRTDSER